MNQHVFPRVFDALARREGRETTLPTLASLTGLEQRQIKAAIANARRSNAPQAAYIEIIKPGQVWKFNSVAGESGDDTIEEVVEAVNMGAPHIWKRVLKAFTETNGEIVSSEQLARLVSADGGEEITASQVSGAMTTIMRKAKIGAAVKVVWAGRSWQFVGKKPRKASGAATTETTVSPSIRSSVLRYFTQRPGDTLFADDVASDLGFTRKQVQSAMWALTQESSTVKDEFKTLQGGQSWRYLPNRVVSNGQVEKPLEKVPAQALAVSAPAPVVAAVTPSFSVASIPVKAHVPNIPAAQPTTAVATSAAIATPTGGRLFEEIAQLPEGAVLVKEGESGAVYRATPLV